jgi:hypothetical protein
MQKFSKYLAISVAILFPLLGVYMLVSTRFSYIQKEYRVIFAIFLFLYGSYRLARILTQRKQDEDE